MNIPGADPLLLEELYEKYKKDPSSLDSSWKDFFEEPGSSQKDQNLFHLIEAYRNYGHLLAQFNPIATEGVAKLSVLLGEHRGEDVADREESIAEAIDEDRDATDSSRGDARCIESFAIPSTSNLEIVPALDPKKMGFSNEDQIVKTLKKIYCSKIGFEFKGGLNLEQEEWLQKKIEENQGNYGLTLEEKRSLFNQLNKAELFEIFLHTKYVGQKRFSLEGGETLIPMMSVFVEKTADLGMEECVIGMPHRGRLNALVNILNKSYTMVFHEFEDCFTKDSHMGSGDVKYHKGFSSTVTLQSGKKLHITLAPNPSHLESVDPVVEGEVYARQVKLNDKEKKLVVPLLIHGDAALSGQGVVYEMMQLQRLSGFATGGTIHIVINNQIGFTTLPKDYKSTYYCTDIAKTFGCPVFHVNAEDPEGCIFAMKLAVGLRDRFKIDVFIDLNCYRKYGHNEGDEPAFTQPAEYQLIKKKKSIRTLYSEQLLKEGVFEQAIAEALEKEFRENLQKELDQIKKNKSPQEESQFFEKLGTIATIPQELFKKVDTRLSLKELRDVAEKFCAIPRGFTPHKKIAQLMQDRLQMIKGDESEKKIDWGMAEHLAFATLLQECIHVRLSGQDSRRGTFSQRHSMWVDQVLDKKYFPLSHIDEKQGRFDIYNSPVSEFSILGFEYGYSLGFTEALVIWEAQFGDFSNAAQVIIDQYLVTAEQKWAKPSRLTLFLPHGYEGQGPEHSSGRMERFLQLAGDGNIIVVNPTTPAQLFHLLRRQVKQELAKPLIVFTPKGLLRHPECLSAAAEFTQGSFEEVLDDPNRPKNPTTVVFCSGRVYYDLIAERKTRKFENIAFVRIEQLYPIHIAKVDALIKTYKDVKTFFWVQEEPRNMGAWHYVKSLLQQLLGTQRPLKYIGRRQRASPAVGSHAVHQYEYDLIMQEVFRKE